MTPYLSTQPPILSQNSHKKVVSEKDTLDFLHTKNQPTLSPKIKYQPTLPPQKRLSA